MIEILKARKIEIEAEINLGRQKLQEIENLKNQCLTGLVEKQGVLKELDRMIECEQHTPSNNHLAAD